MDDETMPVAMMPVAMMPVAMMPPATMPPATMPPATMRGEPFADRASAAQVSLPSASETTRVRAPSPACAPSPNTTRCSRSSSA
jgi:hypothetical protein